MPKALSSPVSAPPRRLRELTRSASAWHYAALALGLGVILSIQLSQWFFYDEWLFVELNGPGLLEPHVGHWSTSPMLVYQGLGAVFGLHTYFPYALLVTIIHLSIAHLAWRIMLRAGVNAWIAMAASVIVVFLGSGAENILWAFQIGYLGATALGMLTLYLSSAATLTARRLTLIILLGVFSLTWSGTAIPLVVATAIVLIVRHRWQRALVFAAITGSVYLTWYLLFALSSPSNPDTGGLSLQKLFIDIPIFLGALLILAFGAVVPLVGLGALLVIITTVWFVRMLIKRTVPPAMLPATALAIAGLVFALMSAYSRASIAGGAAVSSRYAYTEIVFLLPLLAVALTTLALRRSWGTRVAVIALLLIAVYQSIILGFTAVDQATKEQRTQRHMYAALSLYVERGDQIDPATRPDWQMAPDLDMGDLEDLYDAGRINIGYFTDEDLAFVKKELLLD